VRLHIIYGAKPIKNQKFDGNWIYLRDELFQPIQEGIEITDFESKKQFLEYKLTSSYPLFFSDAASNKSFFLHESLLPIFQNFNIQKHTLFPIEVKMKEQVLKYYLFNYLGQLNEKDIDFSRTEFAFYKMAKLENSGVKFQNNEEYIKSYKVTRELKNQEQHRLFKLVFNNESYNQLDFFHLDYLEKRMVISERMYEEILKLNHKRIGLDFLDFLTVHLLQANEEGLAARIKTEEEPEALDFDSLTNSKIESGLLKDHEKLKSYFAEFDILKEVKADQFIQDNAVPPEFIKNFNSRLEQILRLFDAAPPVSLVESAKVYYKKLNELSEENKLGTEIIVLGTSFENKCFYTDHLVHGQDNNQIDIGSLSFYLSWDSDHNVPFENLPNLDILEGEQWLDMIEDFEDLPCFENLTRLHHNALRMMFYKTFHLAFQDINTKPIALSFEYYDKEDLAFIYL